MLSSIHVHILPSIPHKIFTADAHSFHRKELMYTYTLKENIKGKSNVKYVHVGVTLDEVMYMYCICHNQTGVKYGLCLIMLCPL